MVKLTIVGRVSDGLALAKGHTYMEEESSSNFSFYKEQAEFILREISRGALPSSKMSILIDHHCFNYLVVQSGIAFIVLCDSSYPRKLVFLYLHDLQKEFEKFDRALVEKITRPYSFVKFDGIIGRIRKQYVDTRTQANLSKLKASSKLDMNIVTEDMSGIIARKRHSDSEMDERALASPQAASSVWCSPQLEEIALKWIPITVTGFVCMVILWGSLSLTESL